MTVTLSELEFESWYAAERDVVVRSLVVLAGDPETARDATAEAFSRAYERWPRVRAMQSPAGWVYRVALNELRRRMRRRRLESQLLGGARSDTLQAVDVDPELWAAVAALSTRQREVIVLRYVADLTEREVAAVLGISEGAASAALTVGRRRLAEQLAYQEEPSTS